MDPVAPLADPVGATRHLRGLLESELLDCFPLNLVETVSQAEIKAVAERAITVFMTAYGPVGQ